MTTNNPFLRALKRTSTVQQIVIGLVLGVLLYIVSPSAAKTAGIFGDMFVGALKAVAPFLVFVLVTKPTSNRFCCFICSVRWVRHWWPWPPAWLFRPS